MAQERYHNYNRPLASWDENRRFAGILYPGRYYGFDTFNDTAALVFELQHTAASGYRHVDISEAYEDYFGAWVTTQGVVIKETASITGLTVVTNAANAFERIDLVVGTHQWDASAGGSAAAYSIIQGPNGGPTEPALTNPEKQVIIGRLHIPASAANLTGATYEPAEEATLNGIDFARRDKPNTFEDTNTSEYTPAGQSSITADGSNILPLTKGNNFLVTAGNDIFKITKKENGTEITLVADGDLVIKHNDALIDLGPGYVDDASCDFPAGTVMKFMQVDVNPDGLHGVWKLLSTLGMDQRLIHPSSIVINAKDLVADRLSMQLLNDTGGGKIHVLVADSADLATLRTWVLPQASSRIAGWRGVGAMDWSDIAHSAGDYTAISGAWAVESGDLVGAKYIRLDNTVFLSFYIQNSVTSGGPGNTLKITLPNAWIINGNFFGSGQIREGSTYSPLIVRAFDGFDYITILKTDNSNFAVGTVDFIMINLTLQV